MNDRSIRVRFAPSPTGHLHIGGLRTALFNLLFARHHNGAYLLRIEDTDLERSKPEYTQAIFDALSWANLLPDEPIVIQSESIEAHKILIKQLLDTGNAYKCYCPSIATEDNYITYEGKCRLASAPKEDAPYVVRLRLPDQETITVEDLIRGPIVFQMKQFDDFIIARSDGSPVYNFVVVVDDAHMKITHVIRGEDHISNTPKQIFLYQALNYPMPKFAHLPLILNEQGGRLSKRDAATSVLDYRDSGYLPEALCNYLVRLGWSHGDQEIFTREELINLFTLDGVGKKGSVFDIQKLNWMNSMYLQAAASKDLYAYAAEYMKVDWLTLFPTWSQSTIERLIELYKSRVNTLKELITELNLVYHGPKEFDLIALKEHTDQATAAILQDAQAAIRAMPAYDEESLKILFKQFTKDRGIKLVAIAQPIRLALVGKPSSPGVFELLACLEPSLVLDRIGTLVNQLS